MVSQNRKVNVSIIIVNYFCADQCLSAVNSIREKTTRYNYEVIIVDNSNDKNEFDKLNDLLGDKCILVNANGNLGFGKANNLGASKVNGDYLLFQNPDTLLINDAVDKLCDYLAKNNDIGIVGPNVFDRNEQPYHSFVLEEMNLKSEKRKLSLLGLLRKNILKKNVDFNYTDQPLDIRGYIVGAFLMMRKHLFNDVGGFDKDIFMYGEDSLLCRESIVKYDAKIMNIPDAKIIHYEGGSFNSNWERHARFVTDGTYLYYLKSFGEKESLKYLKFMKKVYRRKKILTLFVKRNMHSKYVAFYEVTYNKINEII